MQTWKFILDKYNSGKRVILLYVLESKGSSPGRQGFKMAVCDDNEMCGTIGGGIMEHKFVELARSLFNKDNVQPGIFHQVHDTESKNRSGMICSGEQTLFVHQISDNDIEHITVLISSLEDSKNGKLTLTKNELKFSNEIPGKNFYFHQISDEEFILEEKTGYKNILHIIGGGHCSLALSRIMSRMDFHITVYDDRSSLNTLTGNENVNKKVIINYEELGNLIQEGENVYVVIMTFGYRSDDIAVRALSGKKFKYIGLLGSRNKIKKMFDQYSIEILDPEWLKNIHSPVGINIKSETAEEIAISIAAEIIKGKNNQ